MRTALMKWNRHNKKVREEAQACPHCGATTKVDKGEKPRKWHEKTSVTLCVAAGLAVTGLGFIHIITGVISPFELPFDIARKESFGYRETFVNARKIKAIPYPAARIKYPLGCKALQSKNYLESGKVFEARMTDQLKSNIKKWQDEFGQMLGRPEQRWQDRLLGRMDVSELGPEDANTYNNRGIVSAETGQYEQAIANFTRAFERNPAFAQAYFNRAHVYIAIGQLGRGVSDFSKAVEIRRGFADGYVDRGLIHADMGQYDQAISDFTKAVEIDPKRADVYLSRALVCCAKGAYDQAWDDVHTIRSFQLAIPGQFLSYLRAASERQR